VLPFIIAQVVGAALACATVRLLWPRTSDENEDVIVPHRAASPDLEVGRV
jgi:hypothetical protein